MSEFESDDSRPASRQSHQGSLSSCGESRCTSRGYVTDDDISQNQLPECPPQQQSASSSMGGTGGGVSNYMLRLKKQTQKRSDINDLSDNFALMNQKQKKEPFERSCSPLLASEDQIEVRKCESSTGSKFIIKGARSNASMNSGLTTPPPPSQCTNPLPSTIESEECEPAEIIRNRLRHKWISLTHFLTDYNKL